MQKDPYSIKFRICDESTDVKEAWRSMLEEFLKEKNISYTASKNANNYRLI